MLQLAYGSIRARIQMVPHDTQKDVSIVRVLAFSFTTAAAVLAGAASMGLAFPDLWPIKDTEALFDGGGGQAG